MELPVFPLPHVVFFPKTLLPLYIFEPRYRTMVSSVLAADGLLGMVLLRPGWETDYYGSPETYELGCLGRIGQSQQREDGCYDVVLVGIQKFRIRRYTRLEPFRTAEADLIEETPVDDGDLEVLQEKEQLLGLAGELARHTPADPVEDLNQLEQLSYEATVNNLVGLADPEVSLRQQWLELDVIRDRGRSVGRFLRSRLETVRLLEQYRTLSPRNPRSN